MKIFWKSWSWIEAEYELNKLKTQPFTNEWIDANKNKNIGPKDIYLATNGYNYIPGPFKKTALYWEGYTYLKNEYHNYDNNQMWDHRFHFNPVYASKSKSSKIGIGSWWQTEINTYNSIKSTKNIQHIFGMCLGSKMKGQEKSDIGWMRQKFVQAAQNRSFKYYGTGWPSNDRNYNGETYIEGRRNSPIKFNDARKLMAGAKFVLAIENTYHPTYSQGYLTEKIFHGFLSCSIPIYYGCYDVEKMIPENIFIDYRKYDCDPTKVMDHCEKMSNTEYNGYLERIEYWLNGPGKEFSCESRFLEIDKNITKIFG